MWRILWKRKESPYSSWKQQTNQWAWYKHQECQKRVSKPINFSSVHIPSKISSIFIIFNILQRNKNQILHYPTFLKEIDKIIFVYVEKYYGIIVGKYLLYKQGIIEYLFIVTTNNYKIQHSLNFKEYHKTATKISIKE